MNQKNEKKSTVDTLELSLRINKNVKWHWLTILLVTLIIVGMTAITLGLLIPPQKTYHNTNIVNQNLGFVNAAEILCYTVYAVLFIPELFLVGCWISSINDVHRSKYFHAAIIFFYFIAFVLAIIAIIFTIRVYIPS